MISHTLPIHRYGGIDSNYYWFFKHKNAIEMVSLRYKTWLGDVPHYYTLNPTKTNSPAQLTYSGLWLYSTPPSF